MLRIISSFLILPLFTTLFAISNAVASTCGIIEMANESYWTYRDGNIYDEDLAIISKVVPQTKKIMSSNSQASFIVEKAGNIKARGVKYALKYQVRVAGGRTIQFTKASKGLIGFMQQKEDGVVFYMVNINDGSVFKSSILNSAPVPAKLIFKKDLESYYFPDECNGSVE